MAKFTTTLDVMLFADADTVSDLDDLVHETASRVASSVNNSGVEAQVQYLKESGWGDMEIAQALNAKAGDY